MEDGRIRRMQQVGIDDRQQGRFRVPGPVHQQISLPLAVERLGLLRRPGWNLVELLGTTREVSARRQHPRQHHPRGAVVRVAPQVLPQLLRARPYSRFPIQISIIRRSATGRVSRQYRQTTDRDPAEDQARYEEREHPEWGGAPPRGGIRHKARSAGWCERYIAVTRRGDDGIGDHGRFIAETRGRNGLRRARPASAWAWVPQKAS